MRVHRLAPQTTNFQQLWKNISFKNIPVETRSTWLSVVHDIIPTRERLFKIKMTPTNKCSLCNQVDTIMHRLTQCPSALSIWLFVQGYIQHELKDSNINFTPNMFLFPDFVCTPKSKHEHLLYLMGYTIQYLITRYGMTDKEEYMDYLRRSRWK